MKIIQKGNQYTNYSSRDGHVPIAIVDHISGGTMGSMDAWFTSEDNRGSSAHFGVSRAGEIHQFVDIQKMAWANGIAYAAIPKATAAIVKEQAPTNPNKYTVSIEHEGTDGTLTEAQFAASVWLHKHIASEVKRIYGREMTLDSKHVIGHFQVDPVRKPYCPGPNFPWTRLYSALQKKEDEEVKKDTVVTVKVDGKKIADGVLDEGTTYTPARAVAEALGATVTYDAIAKTVNITSKGDK
ncbi:Copper amine oxidase N-terminal domain-containing protein [Paenibacillus sophorae]|uniref:N-acetylmuramoyl-L-alanine amidase n=1 Tax=Paenibacillus sophorae TaxID=1333845 RepID=A0A1H8VRD8_9BACL|nr:N-acetylmuramoyl-L-alanine amidase [Paenibacillus sophorae]QWU15665.1 N-acetylmuramoyl-L-alanine amidase [Paenibacillus sophorae]SEP17894.1 Copper amine oxidase N-terminal domain-containing protein [Paenibacillus sophorae]